MVVPPEYATATGAQVTSSCTAKLRDHLSYAGEVRRTRITPQIWDLEAGTAQVVGAAAEIVAGEARRAGEGLRV